ncbi:MAG: hypothetical protein EOM05_04335 [Clostridia bacterium]|nr:hypothetical protein [Clostridia bacterium]
MKKIIGTIISACILFSLTIPAFAADDSQINASEDAILNLIENGVTVSGQTNKLDLTGYKVYTYNYFLSVDMDANDVTVVTSCFNSVKTALEAQVANGLVINNDGSLYLNNMSSANKLVLKNAILAALNTASTDAFYDYTVSYDATQNILTINDTSNNIPLTFQTGTIIKQTGTNNMSITYIALSVLIVAITGTTVVAKRKKLFVK